MTATQSEIDFDAARVGRDEGMRRATDRADQVRPGWSEDAMNSILAYPEKEFRTEQLRAFAYMNGLDRPPRDLAWGSVMVRAKKAGLIEFVSFVQCVGSETMHAQPVALWRKK